MPDDDDTEREDEEQQLEELNDEQLPGLDPWLPPPSED
jgi:hypothetical protein